MVGKVYIVGVGPGDPELITLKGLKVIKKADVVVYDRLIPREVLNYVEKKNVEFIYVGKEKSKHTISQEEINRILVEKALEDKIVVRLHGGDPFIFGRGFEEVLELRKHGIPYEIIPGITSAIAVPEYYEIPLTYRKVSSSVAIVTGHEDPSKDRKHVNISNILRHVDTVVILMGASRLKDICSELINSGFSKDTPIAILRAYLKPEVKIITTVGEVLEKNISIDSPVIIIIGEVVKLVK